MIIKKIENFTQSICEYNNFSYEQTEEIRYVTKVITLEIIKLVGIIALFSMFGYAKEIILIVCTMTLTKPFTGGYHESSQMRCFIATNILALLIIMLYENNYLNFISIVILHTVNIFSIYHQAPIINSDMPITRRDLIQKNRKIAMTNSIILFLISLILNKYKIYSNIITWTLTLNVCLMFNSKNREE